MARSKDGVMAWVSIAIVLRLHSVKGLTTANIASQLGCTESQLERSCSRFKRLLPADGVPRDIWHFQQRQRRQPFHERLGTLTASFCLDLSWAFLVQLDAARVHHGGGFACFRH